MPQVKLIDLFYLAGILILWRRMSQLGEWIETKVDEGADFLEELPAKAEETAKAIVDEDPRIGWDKDFKKAEKQYSGRVIPCRKPDGAGGFKEAEIYFPPGEDPPPHEIKQLLKAYGCLAPDSTTSPDSSQEAETTQTQWGDFQLF